MTASPTNKFEEGTLFKRYFRIFNDNRCAVRINILYGLKFSGERVLCFHGPLIYEAKCLKVNITKENQVKYLIHYAGWNKK